MALPDHRRHMGYFFVNLLSEKIFKLSVSVCEARLKRRLSCVWSMGRFRCGPFMGCTVNGFLSI